MRTSKQLVDLAGAGVVESMSDDVASHVTETW